MAKPKTTTVELDEFDIQVLWNVANEKSVQLMLEGMDVPMDQMIHYTGKASVLNSICQKLDEAMKSLS